VKIAKVESWLVEIPFHEPGRGVGITPSAWRSLETVLVRVEDEDGNVGWGEGFAYFCADATKAMVDQRVAPLTVGQVIDDVRVWNLGVQRALHLFGRYGITLYAISGVDMALWDLKAKRAGLPLAAYLMDGPLRRDIDAYASLVRYHDPELVAQSSLRAVSEGYRELKLHEITLELVEASREAVGELVPLSVDVNCAWDEAFSRRAIPKLLELGVIWLEEPIFPPEDFATLARLSGLGLPIAAGENWCTRWQFEAAIAAGAADCLQPSVTKIGGIHEYLAVIMAASANLQRVVPHCPYYGPGLYATLQLAAAYEVVGPIEVLYVDREAELAPLGGLTEGGRIRVPEGLGLGFEPNLDVIGRYRRA